MSMPPTNIWLDAARETVVSYRRMIDAAVAQLSDDELRQRPAEGMNSVAVILRHLAGNLQSRWTDFLTTDGEKSDRNRDTEFADWADDRASLIAYFDDGWSCLATAIDQITDANLTTPIYIRGEAHSIPQALERSITHIAYHVGQIVMIARMVHAGEWHWLTIPLAKVSSTTNEHGAPPRVEAPSANRQANEHPPLSTGR